MANVNMAKDESAELPEFWIYTGWTKKTGISVFFQNTRISAKQYFLWIAATDILKVSLYRVLGTGLRSM